LNVPNSKDVFSWLREDVKPVIDERIAQVLSLYDKTEVQEYHIKTGGKRWRPGLVILMGNICDVEDHRMLNMAAGVEMIHNFTLLHDDIIDGDEARRNKPAAWKKFGEDRAIIAGDSLLTLGIGGVSMNEGGDLARMTTDYVQRIYDGQMMDMEFDERRDVSVEEYMEMAEKKTGLLLELALKAPQVASGKRFDLGDFHMLGPAFQIRDDLLDFETGKGRKNVGNDVRAGKRSLMVVHADSDELYEILDKPFGETTQSDVEDAYRILRERGSLKYAGKRMKEMAKSATDSLASLPDCAEKEKMKEMAKFLVERDV